MNSLQSRPRLLALAWPMLAEMVLGFAVGMLGLWLASRESDNSSAAFALANQLQAVFFLLFRVIGMGVSVVITQNLGAGNRPAAQATAKAALGASSWLGLATALLVFAGAGALLETLNAPPAVLLLGRPYLQVLALVLLRGAGQVPALGLVGFALAMALSRLFGLLVHLALWRWRLQIVPCAADWWRLQRSLLRPVLQIGLPGAAENVAYRLAMLVSVTVVAGLGSTALATQTYAFQLMNVVVLFSVSLGFASEILIGHLIGAGHLQEAHRLLRKSLLWGLLVSISMALLVALTAPWTLTLFTNDAQIIASATTLLWLTVLLEPGRTCNIVIINALRATGDARFPVAAGAASMLFVMAGGSWLLGVHFKLGLLGVWIAYSADEWLRGLAMAARWFGHGWVPAARATRRRVLSLGRS